ncbi:hypothetical protein X997_5859 [Burkholderia pseudomallei A79C]|nr:hypothetical protein X997_5859 [Burkholderia pseudomallei A79C]
MKSADTHLAWLPCALSHMGNHYRVWRSEHMYAAALHMRLRANSVESEKLSVAIALMLPSRAFGTGSNCS